MTFSYTLTTTFPIGGGYRKAIGTYTNGGGDSGGAIDTTLAGVESFQTDCNAAGTVNSISISAGTVTLATGTGVDGNWEAMGIAK